MFEGVLDTFQIIFFGFFLTFSELEIRKRFWRWLKGHPQIEEEYTIKAMKQIGNNKKGYSCIITGSNSGVGLETAYHLGCLGYHVIFACRDPVSTKLAIEKTQERASKINIDISAEHVRLDLSDQKSIRNFVEEIKGKNLKIDLLINNAGVMWFPHSYTQEGIETHFGVNYIGHFLLTMLLIPLLTESARILCLGSSTATYGNINFSDINFQKKYNRFQAYSNSKLAISHFTITLSQKLQKSKKKIISPSHRSRVCEYRYYKVNAFYFTIPQ